MASDAFTGRTAVPVQYGGFNLRTMEAHDGWVGSAVDVARFLRVISEPDSPLLSPSLR